MNDMGPESLKKPVNLRWTFLLLRLAFGGCLLIEVLSRLQCVAPAGFLASPNIVFLVMSLLCFQLDHALTAVWRHVLLGDREVFISLKVSPYGKMGYGIGFMNRMFFISVVYFVSLSLNLEIFLLSMCVLVSLVVFMAILPVSLSGTGAEKGADVRFLSKMGLSVQQGFAMALPVGMVTTVGCLPGAFGYLTVGVQTGKAVVVRS